jgi:hypothetical protein
MILSFKPYNKAELFEKIDSIEIIRKENQIITKYFNRVVNVSNVSNRYEIFDIASFLKKRILDIESNFNIFYYKLIMTKGIQELTLLSDKVDINGHDYYKSFFVLNSTDKSRRLNLNLGLYRGDNNTYLISSGLNNISFSKKHLVGVTEAAEEVAYSISGETFDEQIESLQSLVGEKVSLSNIRNIIIDKDLKINHRKFDAFKNQVLYSRIKLTDDQYKTLRTQSEKLIFDKNDFYIDAYLAFNLYMQIFRNQDSYLVRKETEKIIKITQCSVRNSIIDDILCTI